MSLRHDAVSESLDRVGGAAGDVSKNLETFEVFRSGGSARLNHFVCEVQCII